MADDDLEHEHARLRARLREIIFEADTPSGQAFDIAVFIAILLSIAAIMLESVSEISARYGELLRRIEWAFTIGFTVEYGLRLACVERPLRYARSFFGIVDLCAILPTYLSLIIPGSQSLLVIRSLRLLRIFRVFKLARYLSEANVLLGAIRSGSRKVMVFLGTILVIVTILGSAMYLLEGEQHGFSSVPLAMYWAVVTITTVGYGDIVPHTIGGKLVATLVMMLGYCIIAIPTGIMTAEIIQAGQRPITTRHCPQCLSEGHLQESRYCRDCGVSLGHVA